MVAYVTQKAEKMCRRQFK